MKNLKSHHEADVMSRGRNMTGAFLSQCLNVQVGQSKCLNQGWTNVQGNSGAKQQEGHKVELDYKQEYIISMTTGSACYRVLR
jgi:hypothetical protein